MIYFIQAGDTNGIVKIGYVSTLKRLPERFIELQRENSRPLDVIATMYGDLRKERDLHKLYEQHRVWGEWFEPEVLRYHGICPQCGNFPACSECPGWVRTFRFPNETDEQRAVRFREEIRLRKETGAEIMVVGKLGPVAPVTPTYR